jgi:hypothetical protein
VSRYVDELIAAAQDGLDTRMKFIRDECVRSMKMDGPPESRMTHYYLQESMNAICAEMPSHIAESSYGLFRPLSLQYSLESRGGLTHFVFVHGDKLTAVACAKTPNRGFHWLAELNSDNGRIDKASKPVWNRFADPGYVLKTDGLSAVNMIWRVFCMLSMVMTVPGLFVPEKRVASAKLQNARRRSRKAPLVDYINLEVARPKTSSPAAESQSTKIARIRHQVIGHYRFLTAGRPTPKLSFVHSHWRGDSSLGTRIKDYTATDSGISFNPPSLEVEPA